MRKFLFSFFGLLISLIFQFNTLLFASPCATNCEVDYSGIKICAQRDTLCEDTNTWVTHSKCVHPYFDEDGLPC